MVVFCRFLCVLPRGSSIDGNRVRSGSVGLMTGSAIPLPNPWPR
jgi:hypothetical protein